MKATTISITGVLALAGAAWAQDDDGEARERRRPDPAKVHDPSTVLEAGGEFRCLSTGRGITVLREQRDGSWLPEGRIFERDALPEWHESAVPGNRGHLWAPDVIRRDGSYHVYYSVSTFGKNTSAIGLAVGPTLDPEDPRWSWEDRGAVITSSRGAPYNAIDPALFEDEDGRLYMTFGSFWEGIHLVELDPATGLLLDPERPPERLATAPEIEAPFLCRSPGGGYVLFVNWGLCCRGSESTYEIRVGRSEAVGGPYLDREGKDLREGGGTLVLESDGRFIGPGHASILERGGEAFLVHHFYDGENRGRSRLRMLPLSWDEDGWPVVAPPAPDF